ncbi:efflux RND transporter periplasmic adaptor subunit [Pontiella sulfatireligans]|uniref:Multidrug resistance protein MdtA n=1 Tax=Pontiella sulfatireligans TaxID=2750658 RepID=A0A6C2UQS9_9BACT|nr:efflux RND transporter periplasmic adaptor subunit [Pontiella sulfatireligans]VGO22652.1 Multidrug resistance protein MdtA [Pontiella sulfatireligans]
MNNATRRTVSIVIGIAFILGGFLAARYFMKNKPAAQRSRGMSSMVPVVETLKMKGADHIRAIECLGTVMADKDAALQPEVNGRIVAVAPGLVEGGLVKKGDVLVEIESVDYELALAKTEANLLTAQSNYRIEEGQQDVVRHEMQLMGDEQEGAYRDLMLREPQLRSAEANVKSAELAVESAKLNLERTKIRAPFDAVVVSETADIGDYAQSSKVLVELAATDRYFVHASIPLSSLEPLPKIGNQPYAATLTLSDGTTRTAQTYRLLPSLTEKGRMARMLLTTDHPYSGEGRPMLINEYVRVRIEGETIKDALLLPRIYLRDGNVVWTIDGENKLRILPATVLQGYADDILVRVEGPSQFEAVISDLPAAVEGMELRRVGEPAPQMKPGMGEGAGRGKGAGQGKPGTEKPDGQQQQKKQKPNGE